MENDFELYEGKKYSQLVKDIVKNHKNKQNQLKQLINKLSDMVQEPGDAVVIAPIIKGYLDVDVKNDEALVKLAQILQKKEVPSDSVGLDLEKLFEDVQTPIEQIKQLPESKEEIKV